MRFYIPHQVSPAGSWAPILKKTIGNTFKLLVWFKQEPKQIDYASLMADYLARATFPSNDFSYCLPRAFVDSCANAIYRQKTAATLGVAPGVDNSAPFPLMPEV